MSTNPDDKLLPLSPMDAVMHSFGFVILYIFPPSASGPYDLDKLQSSFATLVQEDYPILTGELYIDSSTGIVNVKQTPQSRQLGAAGIRFDMNATNSMTTEEAIQQRSMDLMPTSRGKTELLCVKGTLLSDGGVVIGMDASHTLFDGEAMFTFMTVNIFKRATPRVSVVEAASEAASNGAETSLSAPPSTAHHLFHFTPDMMKRIKQVATRGGVSGDGEPSRANYDWSECSSSLSPPLPTNYVGNVIFNALSTYTDSELQSEGKADDLVSPATLGKLARRVRESILQRDDAYLRDAVNFLAEQSDISAVQVGTNFFFGPDLMFTSWLHMGMYNAEFGGTRPWYACVPRLPCYDGFVMLTEVQKSGDGLDVGVFLECSAMDKLKNMFARVAFLHD
ncbi:hypothetical protein PRIC1_015128 [Phytophthora ramorum]